MNDFTIILRSLTSRLFSTLTTIVTVAVAVGLMLVLLSMRDAGRQAFERGSGNMHLLIGPGGSSPLVTVLNSVFYANPPPRPISWQQYEKIASSFPLEFAIPTQQGDSYLGFPVMATKPEFFSQFVPQEGEKWSLASGAFFTKPFEVVVGSSVARATGLKVGDQVYLTHGIAQSRQLGAATDMQPHVHKEFAYSVVGVLRPTGSSHDRAIFTDLISSWTIHAHDKRKAADPTITSTSPNDVTEADRLITAIYVRVATRPGQQVTAALQSVFDTLRRDPSITVAQPAQQIQQLFLIVSNIDQVFIAMAAVVLLSSGIGIMLALYNSMEQRRRQIAVLRVLGCSRGRIFGLVLTESALIGAVGAGVGLLLCVAGGGVVAGIMKAELGLAITPTFGPRWVLGVIVGTIFLAALAGVIPAVMAYRTSVANNLRPIG